MKQFIVFVLIISLFSGCVSYRYYFPDDKNYETDFFNNNGVYFAISSNGDNDYISVLIEFRQYKDYHIDSLDVSITDTDNKIGRLMYNRTQIYNYPKIDDEKNRFIEIPDSLRFSSIGNSISQISFIFIKQDTNINSKKINFTFNCILTKDDTIRISKTIDLYRKTGHRIGLH